MGSALAVPRTSAAYCELWPSLSPMWQANVSCLAALCFSRRRVVVLPRLWAITGDWVLNRLSSVGMQETRRTPQSLGPSGAGSKRGGRGSSVFFARRWRAPVPQASRAVRGFGSPLGHPDAPADIARSGPGRQRVREVGNSYRPHRTQWYCSTGLRGSILRRLGLESH